MMKAKSIGWTFFARVLVLTLCLAACSSDETTITGPPVPDSELEFETGVPEGTVPIAGFLSSMASPYEFSESMYIPDGDRLVVAPGCSLSFAPGTSLYVLGGLEAVGTHADSIVFTGRRGWEGIRGVGSAAFAQLSYCRFERAAEICISFGAGSLSLVHCSFDQCDGSLLSMSGDARLLVSSSSFRATRYHIRFRSSGDITVRHSSFEGIGSWSGFLERQFLDLEHDVGRTLIESNRFRSTSYSDGAIRTVTIGGIVVIRDNHFDGFRGGDGGPITVHGCSELTITGNTFRRNDTDVVIAQDVDRVEVSGNSFLDNPRASIRAGDCAVIVITDNRWSSSMDRSYATITIGPQSAEILRCIFDNVRLYVEEDSMLQNCLITGEQGAANRGAVNVDGEGVVFRSCLFAECSTAVFGAADMINCTFLDNDIDVRIAGGGPVLVQSCILSNGGERPNIEGWTGGGLVRIEYSLLDTGIEAISENLRAYVDTLGLIAGDPGFDSTGEAFPVGDRSYRVELRADSPCIDSGSPDPTDVDFDGSRNDMGVYGGPYDVRIWIPEP